MPNNSNYSTGIILPELSEKDRNLALSHDGKSWALGLMGPERYGSFGWIKGMGMALQNVGENTLRCICVFDDEPAIVNLAVVNASIEAVGGHLQIGEFTILKEWIPEEAATEKSENEKVPPSGMEVA